MKLLNHPRNKTLRVTLYQIFLIVMVGVFATHAPSAKAQTTAKPQKIVLSDDEKAWIDAHPEIIIGVDGNWPPIDFMDDENKHAGIAADFLNIVSERLGISFKVKPGPSFKDMLGKVMSGQLKVGSTIIPNEKRSEKVTFTKPFIVVPKIIVTRDNYKEIQTSSDLVGKTIAMEKGNGIIQLLNEKQPGVSYDLYPNALEALKAVSFGKADAYIGSQSVIDWLVRKEQITNLVFVADSGIERSPQTFAVFKDPEWTPFVEILNKVLESISEDERQTIYQRWNRSTFRVRKEIDTNVALTQAEQHLLAKHGPFKLGVDPAWPPFEFIDDDDLYSGIGAGYIDLLSSKLEVTMLPQTDLTWEQVIEKSKAGEIDILPSVTRTPEREKYLDFSEPYISFPVVIATRRDASFVSSLDGLDGKRVGVVEGYASQEILKANHENIRLVPFETLGKGLKQLSEGKIDAFVDNLAAIAHVINQSSLDNINISAATKYRFELSMGVRKGLPGLVPIINKALKSVSDRERTAIVNSWTAIQVSYGTDVKTILMWAIPAVFVICLIIIVTVTVNRRMRRDMARLQEAQDFVESSRRELAHQSGLLQAMLESIDQGFAVWSAEEQLVLWNKRCLDFWLNPEGVCVGMERTKLLRHLAEVGAFGDGDMEVLVNEQIKRLKELGRDSYDNIHLQDGGHIFIRRYPMLDGGTAAVYTDITERIKSEEKQRDSHAELTHHVDDLNESRKMFEKQAAEMAQLAEEQAAFKQAADRANQAKSDFLSSMSHELRTPLNAILGFSQMLEYNPKEPLSKAQKGCVDHIMSGGQHLLDLINDVLDLAKIEAGKVELSIVEVYVKDVFEECLLLVETMADDNGVKHVVGEGFEAGLKIRADKTRFKQSLLNLMSNAIKYNSENGLVTVDCRETPSGMLHISVADTGAGIPGDMHEALFMPFNRLAAENTEIEGTGIGLSITKQLIERMGGYIGVDSVVGEGSTFWIELPKAEAILTHQASADGGADGGVQLLPKVNGTILYVEDNPANLTLMEMIISRVEGLTMISAHNAELGIDLAKNRRPGLIILDINLPGLDGYQALEKLQNLTETKDIPVIALSANAMPKDIENGLQAGFIHYLTKPMQVDQVIGVIKEILDT